MRPSALVLMILVWSYIIFFLVYFFTKILRKERDKKRTTNKTLTDE
jgi:hypothetical protein